MAKFSLTICLVCLLAACGAKGDLYLDKSATKQSTDTVKPNSVESAKDIEVGSELVELDDDQQLNPEQSSQ